MTSALPARCDRVTRSRHTPRVSACEGHTEARSSPQNGRDRAFFADSCISHARLGSIA
jgi:hypothetical protein